MNNIQQIREEARIKQVDLCAHLDWRQSRLSNYETGNREPGLQVARQIVDALNELGADCSLEDVFPPQKKESAA
ncbi:transcriptional regulator [Alcanivorax sp. HI0033]|jgi:putative transcriptional regulator|uniref:helix-turn-helix transcriptional regulator n=1 Tax=unclassified Alcanivorax TaxID=2638842 RepID=UPI0007B9451B|nr:MULTISPECIES: helix-turn-helix transcriptional regulator [unclassified Alcanivorax]KZX74047.1 transcriptional regulator [Alcanivorax sp. HI0011]KZX78098.1 transcriptional regulator [Alcanivorax sp. HI0013]KZY14107.1 transcriptional regulator [Alcanivorax sp. HI0035]KZX61276.1 transcriptional regulator [Alcanivorax sp. HI0003]KZX66922.1 transcriptional regulator [Alcanivorax sp. HI0007]